MAKQMGYTPPTPPSTGATDEVDDLVRALHESGLLRAVTGGVRAYPELVGMLLEVVNPADVRTLIALTTALRDLDPAVAERLASGVRRARVDATAAASRPAEGPVALLRRLRDPDTRRGISAVLAAMSSIGAALRRPA